MILRPGLSTNINGKSIPWSLSLLPLSFSACWSGWRGVKILPHLPAEALLRQWLHEISLWIRRGFVTAAFPTTFVKLRNHFFEPRMHSGHRSTLYYQDTLHTLYTSYTFHTQDHAGYPSRSPICIFAPCIMFLLRDWARVTAFSRFFPIFPFMFKKVTK